MTCAGLSMTKDKTKKSSQRRRKPKNVNCVVFSDNWNVVRKYAGDGTSVAS